MKVSCQEPVAHRLPGIGEAPRQRQEQGDASRNRLVQARRLDLRRRMVRVSLPPPGPQGALPGRRQGLVVRLQEPPPGSLRHGDRPAPQVRQPIAFHLRTVAPERAAERRDIGPGAGFERDEGRRRVRVVAPGRRHVGTEHGETQVPGGGSPEGTQRLGHPVDVSAPERESRVEKRELEALLAAGRRPQTKRGESAPDALGGRDVARFKKRPRVPDAKRPLVRQGRRVLDWRTDRHRRGARRVATHVTAGLTARRGGEGQHREHGPREAEARLRVGLRPSAVPDGPRHDNLEEHRNPVRGGHAHWKPGGPHRASGKRPQSG